MKKKCIYLGFSPDEILMKKLYQLDSRPSIQTVTYGLKFICLLREIFNVTNISTAPIQDYPHCKKIVVVHSNDEANKFIPFINLLFFKQISRFLGSLFYLLNGVFVKKIEYVFIHGVHFPFLLSGFIARFFGAKIIIVATDPPGVVVSTDGIIRRFLKRIDYFLILKLMSKASGIIAPSFNYVKDYGFINNIPFMLLPGIISNEKNLICNDFKNTERYFKFDTDCYNICYSGSVYINNGLENLIEAFNVLPNNCKLHIIGNGELLPILMMKYKGCDKIIFHGFKVGEEFDYLMSNMDVLVNARVVDLSFTNYSFPSKLFEYTLYNKIVITSKLNTIPDEISDCFEYFDLLTPEGIASKIKEIISNYDFFNKKTVINKNKIESNYSNNALKTKLLTLMSEI